MWHAIVSWFPSAVWLALSGIGVGAGFDLILTVALAVTGRLGEVFSWRKLPKFLATNVFPYAVAVILGAVLVKLKPELEPEYLTAAALLSGWLAKDWRAKWKQLLGFDLSAASGENWSSFTAGKR